MKQITSEYIRTFRPCINGIIKFEKDYPTFKGTLVDLLKLEKTSYDDKIWLVVKVVDNKILQQWAIDCAESVLHIYEKQYPNDSRIRDCIEITKKYLLGEASLEELRNAESARSAAWYAALSARSAVRSAALSAESARSAAESARSAARSAWYAALSARSAAESARSAAKKEQQDINLSLLIALL